MRARDLGRPRSRPRERGRRPRPAGEALRGRSGRSPGAAGPPQRHPVADLRTLTNDTWHHGTVVLLGDAAHTTHYSIGAGTTLALADAMALAAALRQHPELPQPLARYERERKAALLPVQSAARCSAQWYENLPLHAPAPGAHGRPARPASLAPAGVPPQLYYRLDRAAGRLEPLLRFKRRLGPKGRANRARTVAGRAGVARRTLGELLFTGYGE
ncbi:FAD-dependent monooxygenase [Streptomyces massasporeus]|uniref:FAD-dependent monooxygenase n=1 Tax=Streptomyces massasporeus TaxID=67324 RepID=UPI0033B5BE50